MKITTYNSQEFKNHLQQSIVTYSYYETPAGQLIIFSTNRGIFQVNFVDQDYEIPDHYVHIKNSEMTKFIFVGTDFQIKVWQELLKISIGSTISYQELACAIRRSSAHRAVANAVGDNKIAYFVPCHRVVRKNGIIGGYRWGIEKKELLLKSEINK